MDTPDYSLADVKDEFDKAACPIDLDAMLAQKNPVWYLVETEKISDHGLETFIEILFHSDLDEDCRGIGIECRWLSFFQKKCYLCTREKALFAAW